MGATFPVSCLSRCCAAPAAVMRATFQSHVEIAVVLPLLQVQQLWAPLHQGGQAEDCGTQTGHLPGERRSGEATAGGSELHGRCPALLHTAGVGGPARPRGCLSDVHKLRKLSPEVGTCTSNKAASRRRTSAAPLCPEFQLSLSLAHARLVLQDISTCAPRLTGCLSEARGGLREPCRLEVRGNDNSAACLTGCSSVELGSPDVRAWMRTRPEHCCQGALRSQTARLPWQLYSWTPSGLPPADWPSMTQCQAGCVKSTVLRAAWRCCRWWTSAVGPTHGSLR